MCECFLSQFYIVIREQLSMHKWRQTSCVDKWNCALFQPETPASGHSVIRGLPLPCSFSVYKQRERRMVDAPWRHPSLYFDLPIPKLFSYRPRNTTHQSSPVFKLQSEQARMHSTSNTLLFLLPHVTHVSSGSRNCNNINLSFARELRVSPAKMVGEKNNHLRWTLRTI